MCRSLSCLHLTRGANPRILKTSTQRLKIEMLSARTELMKHTADVLLGRRNPKPLGVVASHPFPVRKELGSNPSTVLCTTRPWRCPKVTSVSMPLKGTWCSGITSAPHAEGPGFKSQCVHLSRMACVNCACVPSATAHLRAFLHVVSELPPPWPRYFPVLAEAHCIKHQISQRIRKREKKKQIMFFESSTWVFLTYHCIMGHMV